MVIIPRVFLRRLIRTIMTINPKGSYACRLENTHEGRFGPIFAASATRRASWDRRHVWPYIPTAQAIALICHIGCKNAVIDCQVVIDYWYIWQQDGLQGHKLRLQEIFWIQAVYVKLLWHNDYHKNDFDSSLLLWVIVRYLQWKWIGTIHKC